MLGGSVDDDDWQTDPDEAAYRADRQRRDQERRASAIANRATWLTWAALAGVFAVVVFSTDDAWGEPRGLGANSFIAFILGPGAAGVVAAIIGDALIGPVARRKTMPRPLTDFASTETDPKLSDKCTTRTAKSRWEERYGERHQVERAKYADTIRSYGGLCMEKVCVMPSRRIEAGAFWHLAHDHERGGPHDYLGPAHPECNEAEARARGVTWDEEPRGSVVGPHVNGPPATSDSGQSKAVAADDEPRAAGDDNPWWSIPPEVGRNEPPF